MLIWKYVGYGRICLKFLHLLVSFFLIFENVSHLYLRMQTRRLFLCKLDCHFTMKKFFILLNNNCWLSIFKDPGKFVNYKFWRAHSIHQQLYYGCASTYFNKWNSLKESEIFVNSARIFLEKHFQASAFVQPKAVAFPLLPFLLLHPPSPVECLNLSYLLSLSLANYRCASLSRFLENACRSHHRVNHFQVTCHFYCLQ